MITVKIGDCREHIPRIVEMAEEVYALGNVSPYQRYLGFYTICPQSYITAYDDNGTLCGYIIAVPVDEDYFESTTKPDFKEKNFFSTIAKQYTNGENKLYLFSIVVLPSHTQRVQILGALARGFVRHLRGQAQLGKVTTEISALALSESGKKICRGIGMFKVAKNSKGSVFVNRDFVKVYLDQNLKDGVLARLLKSKS